MSCLFRALAHFTSEEDTTDVVRQKICNFLALNREFALGPSEKVVRWESNMSLREYVAKMRLSGTWGGATELQAFCELYRRRVHVRSLRPKDKGRAGTYQPKDGVFYRTHTITWNGGHYEPVKS